MVNAFFAGWLWLVLSNDDPPSGPGWLVVICLAGSMLAVAASWRWPRAGGLAVLAGAAALASSTLFSSAVEGLGVAGLAVALIYAAPFVVAGSLALMDSGRAEARPAATEEGAEA
jgi:hypothetical protein